jgi:hypothetical protein
MAKIWDILWGQAGDRITIPEPVQPGGEVSTTQGWGPDYELPDTDPSYKPVGREEMNGALYEITESIQQLQKQGAAEWSADLAPYARGAEVVHAGERWYNPVAGNSTEPGQPGHTWEMSKTAALPVGFSFGGVIANNATDALNDIDVTAFTVRSELNNMDIVLGAAITKRLDAAWAAGNNQGGLFTGAKAALTWYHVFAIGNPTTGVVDVGFDTSINAANRPSGFTYRYLNSIRTDASGNILGFLQFGKRTYFKTPIKDVTATFTPTSTPYTLTTPPGMSIRALMTIQCGSNGTAVYVRHPSMIDIPIGAVAQASYVAGVGVETTATAEYLASYYEVFTNTSSQVAVRADGNGACSIVTLGWEQP